MKNIKDYLHLYIGCECMIGDLDWKPETNLYGLDPRADPNYGRPIKTRLDAHVLNVFSHKTKLILRPLSDMSQGEAIEFVKLFTKSSCTNVQIMDNGQIYFDEYHGDELRGGCIEIDYGSPANFKFLLSKGFDLFGLIEEGLAIDKTKVEPPQGKIKD